MVYQEAVSKLLKADTSFKQPRLSVLDSKKIKVEITFQPEKKETLTKDIKNDNDKDLNPIHVNKKKSKNTISNS